MQELNSKPEVKMDQSNAEKTTRFSVNAHEGPWIHNKRCVECGKLCASETSSGILVVYNFCPDHLPFKTVKVLVGSVG